MASSSTEGIGRRRAGGLCQPSGAHHDEDIPETQLGESSFTGACDFLTRLRHNEPDRDGNVPGRLGVGCRRGDPMFEKLINPFLRRGVDRAVPNSRMYPPGHDPGRLSRRPTYAGNASNWGILGLRSVCVWLVVMSDAVRRRRTNTLTSITRRPVIPSYGLIWNGACAGRGATVDSALLPPPRL